VTRPESGDGTEADDSNGEPRAATDGNGVETETEFVSPGLSMTGDDDGGRDDPLDELAADIQDCCGDAEADDVFEEAFAEMEIEDIDPEEMWAELDADRQPNGHTEVADPEGRGPAQTRLSPL